MNRAGEGGFVHQPRYRWQNPGEFNMLVNGICTSTISQGTEAARSDFRLARVICAAGSGRVNWKTEAAIPKQITWLGAAGQTCHMRIEIRSAVSIGLLGLLFALSDPAFALAANHRKKWPVSMAQAVRIPPSAHHFRSLQEHVRQELSTKRSEDRKSSRLYPTRSFWRKKAICDGRRALLDT
jgi:hypothetical protein